ncbi:Protein N-acetyltransferase, RimJ/RimL family [Chitinophaga terrae (ex Kim and Jung 2007)]|uniref:Protein N-acetyltransferase, RimJ/RimL family n=1 Tax=Chitinophaga terrae (ex Kim and Jung 2007) TaxID=408074 RepID=A0A1H4CSI3_9BACT|nr:GNAT family protein [Chitinophaga terrae (ex Kim and Jung 2007)]MDQ0105248.1 RimJ/RimL family protein N-acetyltransferase [Chitinophaga terrae (ex Kim and Jung 2007)]GEP90431.1 acetyltransferase [Chitinophaga terrae (ex Kim and Jung 2007)]SEA63304.1 Protein N-acetyltransferase, RimJ/RimL family [Chitinophaga terrae (ex Kim and Jung 2007)]
MKHFLPNGDELVIRMPELRDAPGLLSNFQRLTRETEFLLFTHSEAMDLDVASEEDFIRSYLDNPEQLLLLATVRGQIVGSINVNHPGFKKKSHTGEVGISVESKWQNMGIGRRLMTAMLRWADDRPELRLLTLNVFSINEKAMQMYRNFGFMECGRLPHGIQLPDGSYTDLITMYKVIKPIV